jgi:hypothetical protein
MKRWLFAVAIAGVASIAVVAAASAKVDRQAVQTATFTVTQPAGQVGQWGNVWTHDFTVTVNSDGAFTGIGGEYGQDQSGSKTYDETVTGTFGDNSVSLKVMRNDGVTWALDNAQYGDSVVNHAT